MARGFCRKIMEENRAFKFKERFSAEGSNAMRATSFKYRGKVVQYTELV